MNIAGKIALSLARAWSRIAPTGRGGYRVARLARRFVRRDLWRGAFVAPGGTQLELDLGTYPDCCMACGLYELDTQRLIRRLLAPGMHFVDGGANIGYFTVVAARRVGPGGRIDAFEPDPANRARLDANLRINGVEAIVRIHAAALSDRAGSASLYHPEQSDLNHGQASLYAPPASPRASVHTVPLVRPDEAVDAVPHLIKLDIEGAELSALRGMTRWLGSQRPPMLIVEHNPETSKIAGWNPGDLLRAMRETQSRYEAQWIGWRLGRAMTPDEIDQTARQGNILYRAGT